MARKKSFAKSSLPIDGKTEDLKVGCFRCGLCCTLFRIYLTLEEAQRIARSIGLDASDFTDDIGLDQDEVVIRRVEARCIFLEQTADKKVSLCRIHAVRPSACREWETGLWRPACQRGLSDYWNLRINSNQQLEGSKKNIDKFKSFLKTITYE